MCCLEKPQQKNYLKALFALTGSTAIGQLVIFAATPLLTRIYTPDDFAVYGLFQSFVNFCSVFVVLRFEQAIVSVGPDSDADLAYWVGLIAIVPITMVCTFGLLAVKAQGVFGYASFPLHLVPIAFSTLLATGMYLLLRNYALRKNDIGAISVTNVTQNVGRVAGQVLFGSAGLGPVGFGVGELVGRVGAIGRLYCGLKVGSWPFGRSFRQIALAYDKFKNYATTGLLSNLLNTGGAMLPVPMCMSSFGAHDAGNYTLASTLIAAPITLLGRNMAELFHQRFAVLWHSDRAQAVKLFHKTTRTLVAVAIPMFLLGGAFSWFLLPTILGPNWVSTAKLVTIMCPWAAAATVVSPLSRVVFVLDKQRPKLFYDTTYLIISAIVFPIVARMGLGVSYAVAAHSLLLLGAYVLFYLVLTQLLHNRQ